MLSRVTMWSIVDFYRSLGKAFPALGSDSGAYEVLGSIVLRRSLERLFGLVARSGLGLVLVLERSETHLIAWE